MKKSCSYCEEEVTTIIADECEDLILEVYPGKLIGAIAYFRGSYEELKEAHIDIPMNYCPNCGRKL